MFKNLFDSWKSLHLHVKLVLLMSIGSISVLLLLGVLPVLFPEDLKYYEQPLQFCLDHDMREGYVTYGLMGFGALLGIGTWFARTSLLSSLPDDERRRQRRILSRGRVGGSLGFGLTLLCFFLMQFSSIDYATPKDQMINDFGNIAASAYQYRTRPISAGGGSGSYKGYEIPLKMRNNENASYKIQVTPDTLCLEGVSNKNQEDRIRVKLDPRGRIVAWHYEGSFSK